VRLVPVVKDEHRERGGVEVIRGLPAVVAASTAVSLGGVYDLVERRWAPEIKSDPIVWYASPEQCEVVLHDRTTTPQPYQLIYAAEGAGKTQCLAMWGLARMLGRIGVSDRTLYGGVVAPTRGRLKDIVRAIQARVPIDTPQDQRPDAWGTYHAAEDEIRFHFGITLELRAAQQHSYAAGSPIQGRTWFIALDDEDQDIVEMGRDADIEARLRGVKGTERASTATAKDSPRWKMARDKRIAGGDWVIRRLAWHTNPFEWDERWQKFARNLTERERMRRMEAQDVQDELAVYYAWRHDRGIAPLPDLGAIDVTAEVVAGSGYTSYLRPGASLGMIICQDPGRIFQTSLILRAFVIRSELVWYVIDEYISGPGRAESAGKSVTARTHARGLREHLQRRWGCQYDPDPGDKASALERVVVLSDPHARGEQHPDEDTYVAFQAEGFDIFSASDAAQQIKRRARQEMVNGLLEHGRLLIASRPNGDIASPELVVSFETLKKDASGESETDRKGVDDKTHPAVACGYGLWSFEREAIAPFTLELARKTARKRAG